MLFFPTYFAVSALRPTVLVVSIFFLAITVSAEARQIARWTFDSEEAVVFNLHGKVDRDQAGPRPPEYPDFRPDNTALRFDGGGFVSIDDPIDDDRFDFADGDEITIEAWVKVDAARAGQQMYVIGKGRTGSPKFKRDNQNWALRTVSHKNTVRASFLFATELSNDDSHWHRWTTTEGFDRATGWHHIAVAYKFGKPDTIRGWIDGQPSQGAWDMGGATKEPPIVDDDAVWIGSSRGGNPSNSFRGYIDDVAVYRKRLSDKTIASRFNRVGGPQVAGAKPEPARQPERMPTLDVPENQVAVTFAEGLPTNSRWLQEGEMWPIEEMQFTVDHFLLHRIPVKYDSWGIRDRWKSPMLVRMAGDVEFPPGKHRLLLRARSLGRLWIDGKVVARTKTIRRRGGNLEKISPVPDPPHEGGRVARFVQQEVFSDFENTDDRPRIARVVLELVVGGKGLRTESGEVCVAVKFEEKDQYTVLSPSDMLPLTESAFLGIELQCARCHDSPYHSTTQEELYSLAAMLERKPTTPPKTSRVPDEFFETQTRDSLIRVSLKPGQVVKPKWPFAKFTGADDSPQLDELINNPKDTRERLATLFTAPSNSRFPRVMVNHLWKRLMGAGIVEPANDCEGKTPSHPRLLDALAIELVTHDYDLKHVLRLILTSEAYARHAVGENQNAPADQRYFAAPDRRRLTAEQVVDSFYAAAGRQMDVEEITFVHDGSLPMEERQTLGRPQRAWMFAGLNNERDRPSLSLPRCQAVVDVLQAFGWTGTRQQPIADRDTDPNVLQPGILANGNLSKSLTRAAYRCDLAELAIDATSPGQIVDTLFLRFLTRYPREHERTTFVAALAQGFSDRVVDGEVKPPPADPLLPQATWTNHLLPEANEIQQRWERRVQRGPHADPRLRRPWREIYEDVGWSLVNHREFVWIP